MVHKVRITCNILLTMDDLFNHLVTELSKLASHRGNKWRIGLLKACVLNNETN